MNIAVVLAGGKGVRAGGDTPKQFLSLGGKTVLEWSVQTFENHPAIDKVAVVCAPMYQSRVEEMKKKNGWKKMDQVLSGGAQRYESSLAAIQAFEQFPNDNLLLHDAARPLVTPRIISDILDALQTYRAVGVAIPSVDTLVQTDASGLFIESVPNRTLLQRVQTPQAFKVAAIAQAYHTSLQDVHFTPTDDCGVFRHCFPKEKVFLVRGEACNLKLTYKEDLAMLRLFIAEDS